MIAIAHQAALAVEDTRYYSAMVQAERLAAVGQTIAMLSHHIKNILQGIRGGSYLIEQGLSQHDENVVRKGWNIVEQQPGQDFDPGDGHAHLQQGARARPGARRPEPGRRRRRRADASRGPTELNVALEWQPGRGHSDR